MKKIMVTIVMIALVLSSIGCGAPDELVSGTSVEKPEVTDISKHNIIVTNFAVDLIQSSFIGEQNIVLSPVSVLSDLALFANGAEGNSLAQIESVVGLSAEELNEYIYSYKAHLSEISDEDNKLYLANSLWINKDKSVTVLDEFLQANETYCNAFIYQAPFGQNCAEYTNDWISDQTQNIIGDIVNEVPEDSVMYLANGLAFEGVWQTGSRSGESYEFKNANGTTHCAKEILDSGEMSYLEDENTIGFIRYFKNQEYAFAVLLPEENIKIDTYIKGLTGEKLQSLLSNPITKDVDLSMPEFSISYEDDIKSALLRMGIGLEGIEDIFDKSRADLSGLGHVPEGEGIQIDHYFYKTSITIDANGMNTKSKAAVPEETTIGEGTKVSVRIDRPFLIVLMDCENNIPILIGKVVYMPIEDSFSEDVLQSGSFEERKIKKCKNLDEYITATGQMIRDSSMRMNHSEDDLFVDNCVIVKSAQEIAFDTSKVIAAALYEGQYYIQYESVEAAEEAVEILEQYPSVEYAVTDGIVSVADSVE